ncbi:MAG: tRNA lysidine(34) synthetase TilS [Coriobacteriia bacterium]|nr:tRNA lysidine(34) synthetase TilS [Coriobacteriia bacterium]
MEDLAHHAAETIERHRMYDERSALLLMVSGGADSMALLHLLATATTDATPDAPARELPTPAACAVLHVNHGLRAEADADEQFVLDACARLNVSCTVAQFDVAAYAAEHDLNVEDAGRTLRYRAANEQLDQLCRTHDLLPSGARIATAHTLDDRCETFFWRALWGAGTGALGSIPPTRDNIVRPLIRATRAEIIAYLEANGHVWREDATNADTTRTRAAIRHLLMLAAEEVRPTFRRALERTMDLAAADDVILTRMEDAFARDFTLEREPDELLVMSATLLATLEPTMRARSMRAALFATFPTARRIEAAHIDALVAACSNDAAHETFARDLGYDLHARCKYDKLFITKNS